MDAGILTTLLEIKVYALERKASLLKGGRGLQEPNVEAQPSQEDFLESTAETVDQELLPAPQEIKKITQPIHNINDVQINLDDVLASKKPTSFIGESPYLADEGREEVLEECKRNEDIILLPKIPIKMRISSYLSALRDWRVKKKGLEYEYYRTKKEVIDCCYGYDDMIGFIDDLIEREREKDLDR